MDEKNQTTVTAPEEQPAQGPQKFCKFCGQKIAADAVMCIHCGRQVEELTGAHSAQPNIVINNSNANTNTNTVNIAAGALKKEKNKWVAFFLCLFLGYIGAHKFYEGRIGMGILYLFTLGFFGIGWVLDTIILLFKPNPYYI